MIQVAITGNRKLAKKARKLYLQAFPKEERIPWWLLLLNARRSGIDLTAFLEDDVFCGFTASVTVEDMHFVLFFAVESSLRGKGYGSRILSAIKREHPEVVLNVEPLTDTATNLPERKRRFAFYHKNGFVDTGYHVWEIGGKFRVLSTVFRLDVERYKKVFKKLTLGLWNVKLRKTEDSADGS